MSDTKEAIPYAYHRNGFKLFAPSRQLTNQELTDIIRVMGFQATEEVLSSLLPTVRDQFVETCPINPLTVQNIKQN